MERRSKERKRTILGAQIVFGGGDVSIDCIARNMSEAGALLEVSSTVAVPVFFELRIPKTGSVHEARLRWRHENLIGIEFVQASQSGQAVTPANEAGDRASLEAEIRRLRSRLARMQRTAESYGVAYLFKDEAS